MSFSIQRILSKVLGTMGKWFTGGSLRRLIAVSILLVSLMPGVTWACACGCSIFDVRTPSLIPQEAREAPVWLEYDFMNQYINWHATTPSSGVNNSDKQIKTHFITAGGQYMFNRYVGLMVTVPYFIRMFRTESATDANQIDEYHHANFGDVRIWGMYTGLQEDMSLGLLAGFKLATGDHTYNNFDRDTSIGTGSTDLLLGAYKIGSLPTHIGKVNLTFRERPFHWFMQLQYEYPFMTTGNYTPGKEFDGALGTYYNFGKVGPLDELAPFFTILRGAARKATTIWATSPTSRTAATIVCCSRLAVRLEVGQSDYMLMWSCRLTCTRTAINWSRRIWSKRF